MWRILLITIFAVANCHEFKTVHTWDYVEFNFPNDGLQKALLSSGDYIPENNMPLGVQVWKDKVFITVPRWKSGVASNLNYFAKGDKSSMYCRPPSFAII